MYLDAQKAIFKGLKQISTMADPSMHASEDTLLSVVYSWELDAAAIAPVKVLPPTVWIDPDHLDASNMIKELGWANKLQRKKAYRQLQGVTAAQFDITGNRLDAYKAPEGARGLEGAGPGPRTSLSESF